MTSVTLPDRPRPRRDRSPRSSRPDLGPPTQVSPETNRSHFVCCPGRSVSLLTLDAGSLTQVPGLKSTPGFKRVVPFQLPLLRRPVKTYRSLTPVLPPLPGVPTPTDEGRRHTCGADTSPSSTVHNPSSGREHTGSPTRVGLPGGNECQRLRVGTSQDDLTEGTPTLPDRTGETSEVEYPSQDVQRHSSRLSFLYGSLQSTGGVSKDLGPEVRLPGTCLQ